MTEAQEPRESVLRQVRRRILGPTKEDLRRQKDGDRIKLLRELPLVGKDGQILFRGAFQEQIIGWNSQTGWTAASVRNFEPVKTSGVGHGYSSLEWGLPLDDKTTQGDLDLFLRQLEKAGYKLKEKLPSRTAVEKLPGGRRYIPRQDWIFSSDSENPADPSSWTCVVLEYKQYEADDFRPSKLRVEPHSGMGNVPKERIYLRSTEPS